MTRVYITPHSIDPSAVEATKRTLASLPMSPVVNMHADLDERGRIVGETVDPNFVRFACERQGYARAVDFDDPGRVEPERPQPRKRPRPPTIDRATARAILRPQVPARAAEEPSCEPRSRFPTLESLGFVIVDPEDWL